MKSFSQSFQKNLLPIFLVILAITIQIQITIFQSETYNGLRLNLADTALPILGLFIAINLLRKKTVFPQFHTPKAITWLTLLGLVFGAALVHGYLRYGELTQWALINKTVGWGVLCAYFLLGGWLASQMEQRLFSIFIKASVYFFLFISILQCLDYILFYLGATSKNYFPVFPAAGLTANKNVYFFLFSTLLVFTTFNHKLFPSPIILQVFYGLIPFTLIFTGARTALFILPLIFVVLFLISDKDLIKKVIIGILIGIISALIFSHFKAKYPPSFQKKNYESFTIAKNISDYSSTEATSYAGDTLRLEILHTTLNLIKENPILGSGLGSIIKEETSKDFPDTVMDCTTLWLWAETGLIGLFLFLSFYFICLKTLYKNGFNKEHCETAQNLNKSVFFMLLIFGIMSLFHELLYTRFMWLFMGIALAYPLKPLAQHQN